jgi:hypothetical protein
MKKMLDEGRKIIKEEEVVGEAGEKSYQLVSYDK